MKGLPPPQNKHLTMTAALKAAAAGPHGYTFVDAREKETFVSFAEVYARARRVAGALAQRGVHPGQRVAIVLPTGPDFLDAFLGAQLAGAVPVPLYPPVRLGRLPEYHRMTARMLTASGAQILLCDGRTRLLLGEPVAQTRPRLGLERVSVLREQGDEHEVAPAPDDLGLVQFSSGSTVDPKPVALTHHNLVSQCAVLQALMPEEPGQRPLGVSWLPLYHDMGLIGCLLEALYYPGPLVLLPPEAFLVRPALWLRALSRHRGTISPAPNFAYGLCLKRVRDEELEGVDLSAWTYALNGAEPVSPETMRRFSERFARYGFRAQSLMPVYGLSEASLAVTFSPRRAPVRTAATDAEHLARTGQWRPGGREISSVGVPVPGVEVELRDELGIAVPDGRVGRIFVRGPSVMAGYLKEDGTLEPGGPEGWLDTGDLGFWSQGELHVCGRAKDLVIIRGANHAPQEFEDCLEKVGGVRIGCAVALGFVPPDSESEELLVLAERALPEAEDAEVLEQIRAAVVEGTGIRPHTVALLVPGTLPRTSSGKLRRAEALRRYLAGALTAPAATNVLTVAAQVAKSTAALWRSRIG